MKTLKNIARGMIVSAKQESAIKPIPIDRLFFKSIESMGFRNALLLLQSFYNYFFYADSDNFFISYYSVTGNNHEKISDDIIKNSKNSRMEVVLCTSPGSIYTTCPGYEIITQMQLSRQTTNSDESYSIYINTLRDSFGNMKLVVDYIANGATHYRTDFFPIHQYGYIVRGIIVSIKKETCGVEG